jgi:hypothetical protein
MHNSATIVGRNYFFCHISFPIFSHVDWPKIPVCCKEIRWSVISLACSCLRSIEGCTIRTSSSFSVSTWVVNSFIEIWKVQLKDCFYSYGYTKLHWHSWPLRLESFKMADMGKKQVSSGIGLWVITVTSVFGQCVRCDRRNQDGRPCLLASVVGRQHER